MKMLQQFGSHQFHISRILRNQFFRFSTTTTTWTTQSTQQQIDDSNDFVNDFYQHHIEINNFQRTLLTVGSAFMSLIDPYRADLIACFGETAGESALIEMYHKMEDSQEGSEILKHKPRINSRTVDLGGLKRMPEGTLGRAYSNFLEDNQVTPDSRLTVQFVDDINLAYVLQRYREVHDIFHTVLGMPTNMIGEVTVKWVEAYQTKLPMCISAALFGPLRLKPKNRRTYKIYYLPWALETGRNSKFLLNVFFEERWEQPVSELQKEFNIKPLILPK